MVSELKVANAGLENQVSNLRREVDEARHKVKRAGAAAAENAHFADADHSRLGDNEHHGTERVSLSEA